MTACIATLELDIAANALCQWVVQSVIFGTLLALATWSLLRLVRRRCGHTVHGIFWLIVLLKFLIPVGPAWSLSMASAVASVQDFSARLAQQLAPTSAAPTSESAPGSVSPVIPILVMLHGAEQPAARAATTDVQPVLPVALILSGVYAIGVIAVGSRRIWRHRGFAAQCRRLPLADEDTRAIVASACRRIGLGRVPTVRIGDDVPAPFILGALRPTLVLPSKQLETPAELQAVVLHEVAHLRRGDLFVRYLQWITGTLLFFWPVVAWVNRRIDLARESACDDWALRHGQLTEGEYARCLLRALRSAQRPRAAIGIAAMAANKKNVERRIEMILDKSTRSRPRGGLAVLIVVILVAWATFVLTGSANARVAPTEKNMSSGDGSANAQQISVVQVDGSASGTASFTIQRDPADPDGEVFIAGPDTGIADEFRTAMFVADSEDGTSDGHASFVVMALGAGPSAEQLAEFAASHPTADADGDGTVSKAEHDAYLVALAMTEPAAVMVQFAGADQNKDGRLDAGEAADLVSHGVSFAHSGEVSLSLDRAEGVPQEYTVEIAGIVATELDSKDDVAGLPTPAECDIQIETDSGEGSVVVCAPRLALKDRRGDDKGGPVMITGPAMNQWVSIPDAVGWLLDNVSATPTAAEVAGYVPTVRDAPLNRFLRMEPESDANGDGALTEEERDAFLQERTSRIHAKLLEKHPDADTNGDGTLDKDEMMHICLPRQACCLNWVDKEGKTPCGEHCLLLKADGHCIAGPDGGKCKPRVMTTIECKGADGKVITINTCKEVPSAADDQ